jgi:hypothetical protein
MSQDDLNKSVVAHLFLAGKPLVLNYQLMENRLKRPRLTAAQRAEYNRQLSEAGGFLTVADRESDDPLLIHFRSENDRYTMRVVTPGMFFGFFLSMEKIQSAAGETVATGNLVVTQDDNPTRFYMNALGVVPQRLLNVARKPLVSERAIDEPVVEAVALRKQDEILGPTYIYKNESRLENDPQRYFSDTFLRAAHVIWDPVPVEFGVQVRGSGIVEFSDIGLA